MPTEFEDRVCVGDYVSVGSVFGVVRTIVRKDYPHSSCFSVEITEGRFVYTSSVSPPPILDMLADDEFLSDYANTADRTT